MTQEELDPRVRRLLEDAVQQRDLDMAVVEELFDQARRLEGEELEQAVRNVLGRA